MPMKRFLLGALVSPVLLALAIFIYLKMGYLNTRADIGPSSFDT
jgi:hypothetical protein